MSVNVTMGVKNWPISRGFLLVVSWFFKFFQISDVDPKLYAERHILAIFHAIGRAIASTNSPEKKKKEQSKPTEKI